MSVTKACRDMNELTPLAKKACDLFLKKCRKAGLNIFITETYRSQERQNYLYEQGRIRPGQVVTWTKSSRHTSRRAWDIACNGSVLYDMEMLRKAGSIAKSLGITWGGTWDKSPDYPHFEIEANWKEPEGDEEMVETSVIVIDGKSIPVRRILKEGTNYIAVRDIASAIGFNISNKGNTPVLTKK